MAPETQFWWNWWVQLGTALATLLAVLIALFLGFRDKFFPPLLSLRLVDPRGTGPVPTSVLIPASEQQTLTQYQTLSRWYHVRVENGRRVSRATDTQVCVIAVELPNAAGQYIRRSTGAIPLKIRHEGTVRPGRVIGPPVEFDLCSVTREFASGSGPAFELHTIVAPNDLVVRTISAFRMIVTLQARSIEADSDFIRIEIAWNGQWSDDTNQMVNNLVLTHL